MVITVKNSIMVLPMQQTPQRTLWISNLDLLERRYHVRTVYFYKANGVSDFFDAKILKESLSKVLVPFYPMAGRLKRDEDGQIEIDCNGKGSLFVDAVTESVIDDFGEFTPSTKLQQFIPNVNYSVDISSYPLLVLQATRFKCGGVCLGVGIHHTLADGAASIHFMNSWSDMARGLELRVSPFMDRSLLKARDPPSPTFPHMEYQPPPTIKNKQNSEPNESSSTISIAIFKLTEHQLWLLKAKAKEDGNTTSYSTFEILSAHVWRCVCKARNLLEDQETQIYFPINGRSRLQPPLPPTYLGNAIFLATTLALSGDIQSRPLAYVAGRIHDAIARMDDEYLRSALDYLELQEDITTLTLGSSKRNLGCPNIWINSWLRFPLYEEDFGWGRPAFVGRASEYFEGQTYFLPSPIDDGCLKVYISLESDHMVHFKRIFYDL